jgi:hypothetical protein
VISAPSGHFVHKIADWVAKIGKIFLSKNNPLFFPFD